MPINVFGLDLWVYFDHARLTECRGIDEPDRDKRGSGNGTTSREVCEVDSERNKWSISGYHKMVSVLAVQCNAWPSEGESCDKKTAEVQRYPSTIYMKGDRTQTMRRTRGKEGDSTGRGKEY